MTVLPNAIGVTIPDKEPTVAAEGLLLVQVPPPASVKAVDVPMHTVDGPVIAAGAEITLTVAVAKQPDSKV